MELEIETRGLEIHEVIFVLYNLATGFTPKKSAETTTAAEFAAARDGLVTPEEPDILKLAQSHTRTPYGSRHLDYFRGTAMKLHYEEMYSTGILKVSDYLRERGGLVNLKKLQSAIDEYATAFVSQEDSPAASAGTQFYSPLEKHGVFATASGAHEVSKIASLP